MIERNLKVIFIPKPVKNPVTGGEIYNLKLLQFLRKKFRDTEPIEIGIFRTKAKKDFGMLFFGLTSIIRNLFYIYEILKKNTNQKTVILEDIYYSTDLFLFNFFIKRIKKNVSIVPIVHHLYYISAENRFVLALFRTIEAIFLDESDWIIANSEETERSIRFLLKRTKKFLVAQPGLDKKKAARRKTSCRCDDSGSSSRILSLLVVGSLTERKDFETLLKAIKVLVDRYDGKGFFVNVVGDLEKDKCYSARILEMTRALSLSNHVAFKGRVNASRLFDFYARSDIFVSTSLHEGFGMALAEAMYNRLPVVATNCGATPYLVEDGGNGFLVPPRDYGKLAEKIVLLLESEELRKRMGDKGFYKAKDFDWNQTFNKIYRNLLET